MKLRHQIAAGAALIFLVGCSHDQPMGADKDASASTDSTNINEIRQPAQAPATLPPSATQPAQPGTDSQQAPTAPTTSNPPPAALPGNTPPGDHQ